MHSRSLIHDAESSREIGGFTISTTLHPAGSALAPHYHVREYFCFVVTGQFEERAGGGSQRCGAEAMVFHPPGDIHADVFDATTRCLNIELPPELGLARGELRDAFARRDQRRGLGLAALGRRIHRELRRPDAASGLALQGMVLELAAAWSRSRETTRRPVWLDEVIRILRAELATALDFGEIADRVGVHPARLSREFQRAQQVTMTEFVARLRVEHAARLLRTSDRPLAAIALDAGFADQSHLGKVFRRHTGTTCARFRADERQARTNAQAGTRHRSGGR